MAAGMGDSFIGGQEQCLTLQRRIDLTAASALRSEFLARSGQPLRVDAAGVGHLGGLGLQVLLAAAQHWRQSGQTLVIEPRSAAFDAAIATFGLSPSALEYRGAE